MRRAVASALVMVIACSLAVLSGTATLCRDSGSGLSVTLTLRETAGISRRSEPVTSGVPVARALDLKTTDGLKVTDGGGTEVPAQFGVTARWGGSPQDASVPIRWLLADFQADVEAGGTATYHLTGGGSGSPPSTGLRVIRNDSSLIEIATGKALFRFSKRSFNLFDSVRVGSSQVVSPAGDSGLVAVTPDGKSYLSSLSAPREVVLETDGPLRKTLRIVGGITGEGGDLLTCAARISLYSDSAEARVQLSVENQRDPAVQDGQPLIHNIGSPRSAVFKDLTMALDCEVGSGAKLRLEGAGKGAYDAPSGSLEVYQDSSGTANWDKYRGRHPRPQSYVSFRGFRVYRNGGQAGSGNKAAPTLDLGGSAGGASVAVRDFWQNYPKALRGNAARLEVSLFPEEYAGDYFFRPRERKTHDITFCFHGPGVERATALAKAGAFREPLFAAASPSYYLSTGAAGRVTGVFDDAELAAYEELNRATLDGEGANLYRAISDAEFYSWQDYGEVPVDYENGGTGTLNHKYNFDLGMMLQFMRTGDLRWFRLAEAAGRHIADLDVLHTGGAPDNWWEGGFFGHSYHDEESDLNPNRNEGAPHPDLVFGAPGLFLLYHMTGNREARDAAVEISENIKYRFDNSFGRGNGEGYAGATDYENGCESARPFGCGLMVLTEAYRATGDRRYVDTSEWLISNAHLATDLFITQPVPGDRRYTKVFTWDLLAASLGRYLDVCGEFGRDDGAGGRDLLLDMTRQEARVMWKVDGRGNRGVPYAWMRDGTPWGWEESEVAVNVCNWHLLTADALAYGYAYGGGNDLLERAREAFKTGSNPDIEYYEPVYTATKEATNSANFGLAYIHLLHPPSDAPATGEAQFNEYLCIENPYDEQAKVRLDYYFGGGGAYSETVTVPGRARHTVDVNASVGQGRDVSVTVRSDRPVVVERPMYFNYHGSRAGGHVAFGAAAPSKKWYFAEGCTRPGFEQWMTIENDTAKSGRVTLSYMLEAGGTRTQTVVAAALSRTTVDVNGFLGPGHDVSTLVESEVPVVVERPLYFRYRDRWSGGHVALGATAPSRSWYFAEGTTRNNPRDGSYEQWLCLQNPGDVPSSAHVSFMLGGGGAVERDYPLAARGRLTIDVNREVGPDRDVSALVTSGEPIVAESPIYYSFRGAREGGDDIAGVTGPRAEWHFAEGCTRDGFNTWLSIGNPQEEALPVTVEYYLASGRRESKTVSVPPRSRSTVDVNMDVGPGEDVSCRLSAGKPFIAARPVYFNYRGAWDGGHCAGGAAAPGKTWYFAEGCTR